VARADLSARLAAIAGDVRHDVLLAALTTLGVGGPAKRVVLPRTIDEMAAVVQFLRISEEPGMVLGAGSNVLFPDTGYAGTIVLTTAVQGLHVECSSVQVTCGVRLPALLNHPEVARSQALNFLAGIPGTVGGAVVTNAGVPGVSIGDVVIEIHGVDAHGSRIVVPGEACGFRYRGSLLGDSGFVVLAARLDLAGERFDRDRLLAMRRSTQPVGKQTAGCVFRNPATASAGSLIERAGLKGLQVGDAEVSPIHANFIVNNGQAKAAEIRKLIDIVRRKVYKECRVLLELEIEVVDG